MRPTVDLIDGTYELFRQFHGRRRFEKDKPAPFGAVQVLRRARKTLDGEGVKEKYGVAPERIPDFLALVGDSADGYPGIEGIGRVGAAALVNAHGALEDFPSGVLGKSRASALLFKKLATLRTDARLFAKVDELRWRGPKPAFGAIAAKIGDARLNDRCSRAARAVAG